MDWSFCFWPISKALSHNIALLWARCRLPFLWNADLALHHLLEVCRCRGHYLLIRLCKHRSAITVSCLHRCVHSLEQWFVPRYGTHASWAQRVTVLEAMQRNSRGIPRLWFIRHVGKWLLRMNLRIWKVGNGLWPLNIRWLVLSRPVLLKVVVPLATNSWNLIVEVSVNICHELAGKRRLICCAAVHRNCSVLGGRSMLGFQFQNLFA